MRTLSVVGSTPLIVEAVALRRRAANFVEAVAPRRRGERSRTTLPESPPRVNAVRPSVGTRGLGRGQQLLARRELHARALLAAATLELLGVDPSPALHRDHVRLSRREQGVDALASAGRRLRQEPRLEVFHEAADGLVGVALVRAQDPRGSALDPP